MASRNESAARPDRDGGAGSGAARLPTIHCSIAALCGQACLPPPLELRSTDYARWFEERRRYLLCQASACTQAAAHARAAAMAQSAAHEDCAR